MKLSIDETLFQAAASSSITPALFEWSMGRTGNGKLATKNCVVPTDLVISHALNFLEPSADEEESE
jgi:hypothetical protein